LDEAYGAIDWKVIVLLAGVLPLGLALEKTGAAQLLANQSLHLVDWFGPIGALAAVYLVTLLLTEMMSNTAAAAMMVPIGISTAVAMSVSPRPFLMAVTFAASVNFATPVGYQTNLMVYTPGGYKFRDYLRVGIPLDVLFAILAIWLIPKFWPFSHGPSRIDGSIQRDLLTGADGFNHIFWAVGFAQAFDDVFAFEQADDVRQQQRLESRHVRGGEQ